MGDKSQTLWDKYYESESDLDFFAWLNSLAEGPSIRLDLVNGNIIEE